jgi:DNA-binding SARP family transcriptional activator
VPLGGPRHRILLATLLICPGRVVPADRLIEALWGAMPPRRAVEMLHVRISELRWLRAGTDGGLDLIVTGRPGYLLDIAPGQLDAHRFERSAAAARRTLAAGDAATAAEQLRGGACAMGKGPR